MDLIIHHGHCPDGWCAAYIAQKRYPGAKLVALDHGLDEYWLTAFISGCSNLNVLMVDYSLRTRELNDQLNSVAKSFRILDHHKTAQAVLEGAPYAVFDMTRSGAGLAWDYLFGKDSLAVPSAFDPCGTGLPRPWYVNYVEDRDLWNWKLPNSRAVCAYLGTYELTTEAWDELAQIVPRDVLTLGNGALAHIDHYVREAIRQAQPGILQGYKTAVLNIPYLNCSEAGNALAKTHEVSLTWFERADGFIQFSLRSIGDIDVSTIAKVFNGGGHKNAAGFQLKLAEGRRVIDDILGRRAVDVL